MIKNYEIWELPIEMQKILNKKDWSKIKCTPLRKMSNQTGLSINTLRNIRNANSASYSTWQKLIERL